MLASFLHDLVYAVHVESLPTLKVFILLLPWWISSALGHHSRPLFNLFICNHVSCVNCFRSNSYFSLVLFFPGTLFNLWKHTMAILGHSSSRIENYDYELHFLVKYVHEDFSARKAKSKCSRRFWHCRKLMSLVRSEKKNISLVKANTAFKALSRGIEHFK